MRPHLGHVKDVPLVCLRILGIHNLDKDIPLGVVALLNSLKEVLGEEIGVFAGHLGGGLGVEVLGAPLGLEVELDILEAAVLFVFEIISWMDAPCINKLFEEGKVFTSLVNLYVWPLYALM